MNNFQFYSPTEFLFGKDTENSCGAYVKKYGGTKVLIHYGSASAVRSGLIDRVKDSLTQAGISYVLLGGVQPNPRSGKVYEGIEIVRREQIDFLLALGGGKLTGQGLFNGTQTQSEFSWSLPYRHTDFIFSAIGEELGMVGCLLVIVLLTAIVVRCLMTAAKARNRMEAYICVGMAAMLIFQTISNIGMCLFVMPVIGLTLPFFSYGGSSILTLYMAMGLVSGVRNRSLPEWLRKT